MTDEKTDEPPPSVMRPCHGCGHNQATRIQAIRGIVTYRCNKCGKQETINIGHGVGDLSTDL